MCYPICDFDIEAQVYVEAWKSSKTKNELFELLEESEAWVNRRERLMKRAAPYDTYDYRRLGRKTMGQLRPERYTTWKMAKYMHKALQRKGVLLPYWESKDYYCSNSSLPLVHRLNKRLAIAS